MAGYQSTTIVGNVGREPELRYLQSGVPVCNFSVAVTRKFGQGDERTEKTVWFKVACWRKLAETANQFVRKGMQIMIVGDVSVSAYTDRDGQPAASLEINANVMQFLGSRQGDDYGAPQEDMSDIPF